jgi:hypothetical protein
MSEEIIERQIEILEEKLRDIQSQKYDVIQKHLYEKAAALRDEEREVMEQLLEKDPGNEMVYSNQWYVDRFLKDGNKLEYIQELAKDSMITVKYTLKLSSDIEFVPENLKEVLEKYNISEKEWVILCKEYNRINEDSKTFSIDPSEGGTMRNYEIAVSPKKKNG